MFLNDLDPQFIKSINYLYSSDNLAKTDTTPLQFFLEEAIKNKNGVIKDLTAVVSSSFKQRGIGEYKPFINNIEESKASNSDNELELDLLKEDLMCIVCNGMDVGARNRLLECSDCHSLYHQECHKPIVVVQDSYDSWVCQDCKDASKKAKLAVVATTIAPPTKVTSTVSKSNSTSHRHSSSSYKSSTSTTKSDKYSKTSSKSTSGTVSKPGTSSTVTARTNVTPNINIISADKRIQIMKKKAAKLQEKRKHLPR